MAKKKNKIKKKHKASEKLKNTKSSIPAKPQPKGPKFLALGLILIITFCTYIPSLQNEFVNWDDDKNFLENELVSTIQKENFWSNTSKIFKSDVIGGYNPLTVFSFAVDKLIFGFEKPQYWHLHNILLHLITTAFVFLIGYRLRLGLLGAIILAMLFGIQPMRVESVAWVTERKDVLFGAYYMAALYFYIKGKQEGFNKKKWIIISICFLFSLLSKIQAVFLPISMILVDYYLSRSSKITFKSIISKAPFLLGSLTIGLVNIYFLSKQGSIEQQEYHGISRIFIGGYQLAIYYVKSLIPFRLSPLYPYPSSLPWYMYASLLSFFATGGLLWWSYMKKRKVMFFGIAFFFSNVFLLLQILGAGQGFLADRFTYIAYFGLFFIYSFYINKIINKKPNFKLPLYICLGCLFALYAFQNFNQNKVWKNSDTLWSHVLKYYDRTTLPFGNRANYRRDYSQELLRKANKIQNSNPQEAQRLRQESNKYVVAALDDYSQVIRLKPNKPEPYNSRARLYFNFDQRDSLLKALDNYNQAITLKPRDVEYRVNLGATYAKLGDFNKSLQVLNEAENIDQTWANIYLNRSVIYNMQSNFSAALKDINKYLAYKPYNRSDMWYEKGRIHNYFKQYNEALEALNRAIQMQRNGIYYFEKAKVLFSLGRYNEAKRELNISNQLGYKGPADITNQILQTN